MLLLKVGLRCELNFDDEVIDGLTVRAVKSRFRVILDGNDIQGLRWVDVFFIFDG